MTRFLLFHQTQDTTQTESSRSLFNESQLVIYRDPILVLAQRKFDLLAYGSEPEEGTPSTPPDGRDALIKQQQEEIARLRMRWREHDRLKRRTDGSRINSRRVLRQATYGTIRRRRRARSDDDFVRPNGSMGTLRRRMVDSRGRFQVPLSRIQFESGQQTDGT